MLYKEWWLCTSCSCLVNLPPSLSLDRNLSTFLSFFLFSIAAAEKFDSLTRTPFTWARIACWLERWTGDQKVTSSNPSRSGRSIFFSSQLRVLTLIRCLFHPCVTAVACKRPRSFCRKCRWQVIPKHAYTFDPTKSEWADYTAV